MIGDMAMFSCGVCVCVCVGAVLKIVWKKRSGGEVEYRVYRKEIHRRTRKYCNVSEI